jgi:hypothetical protein
VLDKVQHSIMFLALMGLDEEDVLDYLLLDPTLVRGAFSRVTPRSLYD